MGKKYEKKVRNLILVFGDQLNLNSAAFDKKGPPKIKSPRSFRPDPTTQEVIKMVARELPDSPGQLKNFDYPVTHEQALAALRDFTDHRLGEFGT